MRRHTARTKQHRRNTGMAVRLLTMAALVAVILICMLIFFKIGTITVEGSQHYTEEEIATASGLSVGDNLVMLNKTVAASKIKAWLPYVEDVKIRRKLPNQLTITVTECEAAGAAVSESGSWWSLDSNCKLLEETTAEEAKKYPVLSGVVLTAPVSGCAASAADPEQITVAQTLLTAMEQWDLVDVITTVDLSKLYGIVLWYGDRFEIDLGSTDNLAYKIQYLQEILKNLNDGQSGVIDLTFETETVARFLPW